MSSKAATHALGGMCGLALVLLGPVPASAQGTGVTFGIQGGAGVADQRGDEAFFVWDVVSPQGGLLLNVPLGSSGRVGLQIEAMFLGKGGRENTNMREVPMPEPPVKQRQLFFQAPVLLRIELSSGSVRPVLFGGFAPAVSLNCRVESFSGPSSIKQDCSEAGLDQRKSQFDAVFGGGLNFDAGNGVFVIDLRADVQLGSADDSPARLNFSNRDLAVLAGYRFPLGGR